MNKFNTNTDIGDIYFIFADNIYTKYLTYEKFKALLNYYALLYGKIIIPDTFLINNKFLQRFFIDDNGIEYINRNIIVPSTRNNITSLNEVYMNFKSNGTFIGNDIYGDDKINTYLEAIEVKQGLTWNIEGVSNNFNNNIINQLDLLDVVDVEDKKMLNDKLYNTNENNLLTRKIIRDTIENLNFKGQETKEIFNSYVDTIYNFNIPNFLGTSVAYPKELMNQNMFKVSPEDIFLKGATSEKNINEVTTKNEYIINTSLFNTGILTHLNAEQIQHIRKSKEYKTFLKIFKNSCKKDNQKKLENSFINYIEAFENELSVIIKWEGKKEVDKLRAKLKFMNMGRDSAAGDGAGMIIDLVLEGMNSFVGAKILGKAIQIITSPISRNTEVEIKKRQLQGASEINKIKSNENIYETVKQLGLNSVKG